MNAPGSWRKPRPRPTLASPSRASAGRDQELSRECSSAESVGSAPKKDGRKEELDASRKGRADSRYSLEKKEICVEKSSAQTDKSVNTLKEGTLQRQNGHYHNFDLGSKNKLISFACILAHILCIFGLATVRVLEVRKIERRFCFKLKFCDE